MAIWAVGQRVMLPLPGMLRLSLGILPETLLGRLPEGRRVRQRVRLRMEQRVRLLMGPSELRRILQTGSP